MAHTHTHCVTGGHGDSMTESVQFFVLFEGVQPPFFGGGVNCFFFFYVFHVNSGPIKGLEKTSPNGAHTHTQTDMATL